MRNILFKTFAVAGLLALAAFVGVPAEASQAFDVGAFLSSDIAAGGALAGLAFGGMAFDVAGLDPTGAGRKGAPKLATYVSTADTLATILADGYFDTFSTAVETNDRMYIVGTDGAAMCQITSASGDVALAVISTDMAISSKSSEDVALAFGSNMLGFGVTADTAYTLPTPQTGLEVEATLQNASTGSTIVDNSTGVTIGAAGATLTLVAGDTVRLRATSATRWEIVGGRGEAVLS